MNLPPLPAHDLLDINLKPHFSESALKLYGCRTLRSLDTGELRNLLRQLQNCEMSVSRAQELIAMWTAGNYTEDMLPLPAQHHGDLALDLSKVKNVYSTDLTVILECETHQQVVDLALSLDVLQARK